MQQKDKEPKERHEKIKKKKKRLKTWITKRAKTLKKLISATGQKRRKTQRQWKERQAIMLQISFWEDWS